MNYYSKIIDKIPESKIILYNFEKLCGYKFSIESVEELVKKFPDQIVGLKDSSYNLYDKINLDVQNPYFGFKVTLNLIVCVHQRVHLCMNTINS